MFMSWVSKMRRARGFIERLYSKERAIVKRNKGKYPQINPYKPVAELTGWNSGKRGGRRRAEPGGIWTAKGAKDREKRERGGGSAVSTREVRHSHLPTADPPYSNLR